MRGIDLESFVEELSKIADGRMGGAPGMPTGADLGGGGGASTAAPPIAPKAPTSSPMAPSSAVPKAPTPNSATSTGARTTAQELGV